MKKIIIILFSIIPFLAFSQQKYVLKGEVKPIDGPAEACVYYNIDGKEHRDSAKIEQGKFVVSGSVPYSIKATLFVRPAEFSYSRKPNRLDQIDIYLENGTVKVSSKGLLKDAAVSGTQLNLDHQELVRLLEPFQIQEAALQSARKWSEMVKTEAPKVEAAYKELSGRQIPAQEQFITTHPNSLVALELLAKTVDPAYNLPKAKSYFFRFPAALRESVAGRKYSRLFDIVIGIQAPDFAIPSEDGKMISLNSYRGGYVLVDFWASWCLPCRMENPNLRKVYAKYKDQNFKVLGISLDEGEKGRSSWAKAIRTDSLTWDQGSELKGYKGVISALYKVDAIPVNFLIDPSGKIIARNLRGPALGEMMEKLFPEDKNLVTKKLNTN
ncbi:TlpA disulfide reductase family protein [Pedobacter jeongneungensis]|uniref:TlpA disulfide reductase family protein n=1 Tax=Pedobacter jeongneungensis TaxID=947309 RepID=UPI00046A090D|nr:TlpA disulfide reductase family protein [Pedobacter jeongneungensis]